MAKTIHTSPPIGQEISCVMKGMNTLLVRDNPKIKKILIDSLKKCKFGIMNTIFHEFDPHGFTMMVLLSESHLAIHTYPEHNAIYFSLYSCRGPKDAQKTFEIFKKHLKPKEFLFMKNDLVPLTKIL